VHLYRKAPGESSDLDFPNLIDCVVLTLIAVGTRDLYIGSIAAFFGLLLTCTVGYTYWRTCRASLS